MNAFAAEVRGLLICWECCLKVYLFTIVTDEKIHYVSTIHTHTHTHASSESVSNRFWRGTREGDTVSPWPLPTCTKMAVHEIGSVHLFTFESYCCS